MSTRKYCENIFAYCRRPTHEVKVGAVGIGGNNPIRIQSMTISNTLDTSATVHEVIALAEAGCEIVRITAPSIKEAENLREIKARLRRQGYDVPLVADIHYTPNAALVAAEFVEKVRINPGNYADKKRFEVREYSEAEYKAELERIHARLSPLVQKCKQNGVAMRIGVNHGSLSDRVLNRYGDTPEGMVQSALEFIRICEDLDYRDIVISMKSSNPQVMIQAYRLLSARMYELGMTYPLHLGVTEAGDGEDGRVKSAVGIGALLEDGLGDTIRVSLTEDAIYEIPVARALVQKYNRGGVPHPTSAALDESEYLAHFPAFANKRRESYRVEVSRAPVGGDEPVRVAVSGEPFAGSPLAHALSVVGQGTPEQEPEWVFSENGYTENSLLPVIHSDWQKGDVIAVDVALDAAAAVDSDGIAEAIRVAQARSKPIYFAFTGFAPGRFSPQTLRQQFGAIAHACRLAEFRAVIFGLDIPANTLGGLGNVRQALGLFAAAKFNAPVALSYRVAAGMPNWQLDAAATLGALLCDGIGNAVYISRALSAPEAVRFSYTLLQATRLRISKTEFISCPSCGRTLFNLQSTTEKIKKQTSHLKGVKIAIMGCIVNGPGEMADADFGYVGSGPGEVNLFVGKECVERNIPEEEAVQRLIALIKRHGKWVEPAEAPAAMV